MKKIILILMLLVAGAFLLGNKKYFPPQSTVNIPSNFQNILKTNLAGLGK